MTDLERIEPSKEAIEAAVATGWTSYLGYQDAVIEDSKRTQIDLVRALKAAYAIDFAQLQAERDQLREAAQREQLKQQAVLQESQQDNRRLQEIVDDAQIRLDDRAKRLEVARQELERLKEKVFELEGRIANALL